MLNDRLQTIEQAFILDRGIYAERNFYRHSIMTSADNELYTSVPFALILDPAFKWWELTFKNKNKYKHEYNFKKSKKTRKLLQNSETDVTYLLNCVRIGFSNLQYTIESATSILKLDGF